MAVHGLATLVAKPPCFNYFLSMTPQRRELILRIADGKNSAFPVLHQLDGFVHADRMFTWLIRNNIVGNTFLEYYVQKFRCSWLSFGKWIVMKINKEAEVTRVIAGKDYKLK